MPPPIKPTIRDSRAIEEFIKELEATSEQVEKLLYVVRASELDFAAVKTELRILCENVRSISSILRDGEGGVSLVTRVLLLEQKIRDLEEKYKDTRITQQSIADIVIEEKKITGGQKAIIATGIFGLLGGIITILTEVLKH